MDKIINYLKELELSEIEAKLYLTLLQNGPISVRDLAETIQIKRTTAYFYIDQLVEKGLVMKLVKGSKKMVAANPPESLQHLVEEKMTSAKQVEQNFPSILKTLTTSLPQSVRTTDAEIKYYKGINAVRKIYEEAFTGNDLRSYVKVEDQPALSSDNPEFFSDAFKKNRNLKVWEIVYESPHSRRQAMKILSQTNSYFYKFMPKDLKWSLSSEDILIYSGKVAIINYADNISCVVLASEGFYNNSKEIFDFLWKMLPEKQL